MTSTTSHESTAWRLKVRADSDHRIYRHRRGEHMGHFDSRDEAESVIKAMPNGREFEIVEVAR